MKALVASASLRRPPPPPPTLAPRDELNGKFFQWKSPHQHLILLRGKVFPLFIRGLISLNMIDLWASRPSHIARHNKGITESEPVQRLKSHWNNPQRHSYVVLILARSNPCHRVSILLLPTNTRGEDLENFSAHSLRHLRTHPLELKTAMRWDGDASHARCRQIIVMCVIYCHSNECFGESNIGIN